MVIASVCLVWMLTAGCGVAGAGFEGPGMMGGMGGMPMGFGPMGPMGPMGMMGGPMGMGGSMMGMGMPGGPMMGGPMLGGPMMGGPMGAHPPMPPMMMGMGPDAMCDPPNYTNILTTHLPFLSRTCCRAC